MVFQVFPRRSYNKNLVVVFHLYEIGFGEDRELKSEEQVSIILMLVHSKMKLSLPLVYMF